MAKPARRSVGDEFRKSVKDTETREREKQAQEMDTHRRNTLTRVSNWLAGIAQDAETDIAKLPARENVEKDYALDIDISVLDRSAVEKTPGFRAVQQKCRELDVDFGWQTRSYRDIDMCDSRYQHEDIHLVIRPTQPYRDVSSRQEYYDPPTGFNTLGP